MYIKRHCQFLLDKEKDKTDAKVRFRVKWDNNKTIANFNIGFRVDVDKWSTKTQRCYKNTTHTKKKIAAAKINDTLKEYEDYAIEIFEVFEKENKIPTKKEFEHNFNIARGKIKITEDKNAFYYLRKFTSEMGKRNNWTKSTYQKFTTLENHFKDFKTNLKLSDFTEEGLTEFMRYFIKKRFRNTTTKKQLGFLKWFLRWAIAKGYSSENAFLNFKPKLKTAKKKIIFLEWNELMNLYNYKFPHNKKYLERVCDVFCFCSFTSLRYSDVAKLKRANIFKDYISITTRKTTDSLTINLNDYSRYILKKYKNHTFENNLALPVISNQKMNEYLKEIGEMCRINRPIETTYYVGEYRYDEIHPKYELLGTHAGRRTFICNALMLGITPETIMKWTGHADYKSMKPYIDVTDRVKKEAMNKFNKVPNQKNRD